MKNLKYYIFALITAIVMNACSEDEEVLEHDVDFCVRAAWQDGLGGGKATRALTATDILADVTSDIEIATDDYPTTINVHCSDDKDFSLTKGATLCTDHGEYWQYTPSVIYKDKTIERSDLDFTFSATIDGGDALVGTADKNCLTDKTSAGQRHMRVTLHHTKALLRFAFKVNNKYDNIRYIRVTSINLNGNGCELVDKVLTQADQFIAYAYIDPTVVTVSYENSIKCTYNIYDKDEATDAHLTRKGVVAQNEFTLSSLKKADGVTPVNTIEAGYYYDLKVTLNPDYLYVMAEHDNKQHITIN